MFSEDTNSLEWREEVIKIGKELGMSFLSTSISDVIQLKTNGIRVCTMNISSGYYNPHMSTEYVVGKDVSRSEYLVHEMIRKNGGRRFEHLKQPPKTYGYSNVYTSDNFYRGYAKSRWGQCCICGDRDFIDVETKICKDCEKISVDNKKNLEIVQKSLEGKTSVQALICCGHKMVYSKPGDIYVCETCCETQAAVPDTSDEADTEKESRPDIFLKKYYVGIFDGNRYYTEDDIIIESIQCQSCLCCEHTIKAHSMEVTCNQCFSRAMTGSIELEINFGGRIYVQNGNDKKFMLKEEAVKTSLYGPDIWVHREEDLEDATSLYGGGFYG